MNPTRTKLQSVYPIKDDVDALGCISLCYTSLLCISLHFISLRCICLFLSQVAIFHLLCYSPSGWRIFCRIFSPMSVLMCLTTIRSFHLVCRWSSKLMGSGWWKRRVWKRSNTPWHILLSNDYLSLYFSCCGGGQTHTKYPILYCSIAKIICF